MDVAYQLGELAGKCHALEQRMADLENRQEHKRPKYVHEVKSKAENVPVYDGKTAWEIFSHKVWASYELEYDFVGEYIKWCRTKSTMPEDDELEEFVSLYGADAHEFARMSKDLWGLLLMRTAGDAETVMRLLRDSAGGLMWTRGVKAWWTLQSEALGRVQDRKTE